MKELSSLIAELSAALAETTWEINQWDAAALARAGEFLEKQWHRQLSEARCACADRSG
jgi:hypothetical protein